MMKIHKYGTTVKLLGTASAVVFIALIGVLYYTTNAVQSSVQSNDQGVISGDSRPSDFPSQAKFRTGIPILRAVEVTNPAQSLYFNPIKQGEHEYLWRAVAKGSTFISNKEMETFFPTFNETGYRFAMQTTDGTRFYRIWYSEPPISVDTHWVNIFIYDDHQKDAKALPELAKSKLSLALDRPFRWVPIDEITAQSIKVLVETEGKNFRTMTKEGDKSIQVMYLGPLSEELQRPEFQAMYKLNSEVRQ